MQLCSLSDEITADPTTTPSKLVVQAYDDLLSVSGLGHSTGRQRTRTASAAKTRDQKEDEDTDDDNAQERSSLEIRAFPPNPLDFSYFEEPMKSEDEAKQLIDWQVQRSTSVEIISDHHGGERAVVRVDELLDKVTSDQARSPTTPDFLQLLVALLTDVVKYQSHDLALKLFSFACECLETLEDREDTRAIISMRQQLLCLALTAMSHLQHCRRDFLTLIQSSDFLIKTVDALERSLDKAISDEEDEEEIKTKIYSVAAVLVILKQSYAIAMEEETSPTFLEKSLPSDLATLLSKMARVCDQAKPSHSLHSASLQLIKRLLSYIAKTKQAERSQIKEKIFSTSSSFSASSECSVILVKLVCDLLRGNVRLSPEDSNESLHAILDCVIRRSRVLALPSYETAWDWLLSAIKQAHLSGACDVQAIRKMFFLVEKIVLQNAPQGKTASENEELKPANHPPMLSDTDSAYCASGTSLERSPEKKRQQHTNNSNQATALPLASSGVRSGNAHLRHYVEMLKLENPQLLRAVLDHLTVFLTRNDLAAVRLNLFVKVILPLLEGKTMAKSANVEDLARMTDLELQVTQRCLQTVPDLLLDKRILAFFHQYRALATVMAFKSVPGLTEAVYEAVAAFLTAQIEHVLYSGVFRRLTAVGKDVGPNSDEPDSNLITDEEAFQPRLMKALTLTSIVKDFHEVLVTQTRKALAINLSNRSSWSELRCAWKTQRVLVETFKEYREYSISKGVDEMTIQLCVFCISELLRNVSDQERINFVFPVVGDMLKIQVWFERENFSGSLAKKSGLVQILFQLKEVALSLTSTSSVRHLISNLLEAELRHSRRGLRRDRTEQSSATVSHVRREDCYSGDVSDERSEETTKDRTGGAHLRAEGPLMLGLTSVQVAFDVVVELLKSKHVHSSNLAEYFIYRLRCLCASSTQVQESLLRGNFLRQVIRNFDKFAQETHLINETVSLIVLLGKRRMTRGDFRSVVNLFKRENLSDGLKKLLVGLREIVTHTCSYLRPPFSLKVSRSSANTSDVAMDEAATTNSTKRDNSQGRLPLISFSIKVVNVKQWAEGLTLCFWMRCPDDQGRFIRLLRLRHDQGEVVISANGLDLHVEAGTEAATFHTSKACTMPWNHFTVSLRRENDSAVIALSVNASDLAHRTSCGSPGTRSRLSRPDGMDQTVVSLEIGDLEDGQGNETCEIASVMVFLGASLSRETLESLLLLSPDTLLPSQESSFHVRKKELLSFFPTRQLRSDSETKESLRQLERSVLLGFTPQKHDALLCKRSSVQTKIGITEDEKKDLIHWQWRFSDLAMQEGGSASLLLLLARVVELGGGDHEIALVLQVIMTVTTSSEEAARDFTLIRGFDLLAYLLKRHSDSLGIHSLTVLLNEVGTLPIIMYDKMKKKHAFLMQPGAILSPDLLVLLLNCWNSLTDQEVQHDVKQTLGVESLGDVVLKAVSIMLKGEFSTKVLQEIHFPKQIVLRLLNQKSIRSENASKHMYDASGRITGIFASMMGSPPNLDVLRDTMTCALLLLEPEFVCVSQDKSNFYFDVFDSAVLHVVSAADAISPECSGSPSRNQCNGRRDDLESGYLSNTAGPSVNLNLPTGGIRERLDYPMSLVDDCGHASSDPSDAVTMTTDVLEHPGQWGEVQERRCQDTGRKKSPAEALLQGLLQLLSGALQNLPDKDLPNVLKDTFLPEYMLIFCGHPKIHVREEALRLMWQYLYRSASSMARINGFFLLANQLHQYRASWGAVNACLSIVHAHNFNIHSFPLEIPTYRQVHVEATRMLPLLAVLPRCMHDAALAHSLIIHIHELFAKVPGLLVGCCSLGLCEVICKAITALATSEELKRNEDSKETITQDLHNFLRLISLRFVTAKGGENFGIIENFLHMLLHLANQDVAGRAVAFRSAICAVVEECLGILHAEWSDAGAVRHYTAIKHRVNIYSSIFPLEEVTELLLRTASAPGSTYSPSPSTPTINTVGKVLDNAKRARRGDLGARFSAVVDFAIDFIVYTKGTREDEATEALTTSLLSLLIRELQQKVDSSKSKSALANAKKLKRHLLTLSNFCLSPQHPVEQRLRIVRILNNLLRRVDVVTFLFDSLPGLTHAFRLYLQDLIVTCKDLLTVDDAVGCTQFLEFILSCSKDAAKGVETTAEEEASAIRYDIDRLSFQTEKNSKIFFGHCDALVKKHAHKYDTLSAHIMHSADEVTNIAMRAQNLEKKHVMNAIREKARTRVHAIQGWQEIIHSGATHERAVWYFPKTAEFTQQSWSLCETEGPMRTRSRMVRKHLDVVEDKYYLPESRRKAAASLPQPFSSLARGTFGLSDIMIEHLTSDNSLLLMENVMLVTPGQELKGEVILSDSAIYFVESHEHEPKSYRWKLVSLYQVHPRRFRLKDVALELFFSTSTTKFIAFYSQRKRSNFLHKLAEHCPRLFKQSDLEEVTVSWQTGEITNFEYLMELNTRAGRTFNDLMQYPVFPFILADYTSEVLDLNHSSTYRDLLKPVAVQNPEKEAAYVANYNALAEDEADGGGNDVVSGLGPFHYGSHYSNSGTVLHYMLRVPPFTKLFLEFQDGEFDLPDRIFQSMAAAWQLSSSNSATDVKELIPDLFCLPEMLVNGEGYNLGKRQDGSRVDRVELPPWAAESPRLFIKVHRQALESDHVRDHLHLWIDLIFGYKQTGQAAVDSINVFHPATYYGFNLSSIKDPVEREARATMIKTYGQTPKQLFAQPHVKARREPKKARDIRTFSPVLANVMGLKWGDYLGSPTRSAPVIMRKVTQNHKIGAFSVPSSNVVYGLAQGSCLLVSYANAVELNGAALISYRNGGIWSKVRRHGDAELFQKTFQSGGGVIAMAASPGGERLWLGFECGKLVVMHYCLHPKDLTLTTVVDQDVTLYGHSNAISALVLCREFGVAVSGSLDGSAIIWDFHRPAYVRSIKCGAGVSNVAISKTSGDIAIACAGSNDGSVLAVCSINGTQAAQIRSDSRITSLTFSSEPEGTSCNALVAGHACGKISMWNSWDLTPIREVCTNQLAPIIALIYSEDNQNLYAATDDGETIIFGKPNSQKCCNYVSLTVDD